MGPTGCAEGTRSRLFASHNKNHSKGPVDRENSHLDLTVAAVVTVQDQEAACLDQGQPLRCVKV